MIELGKLANRGHASLRERVLADPLQDKGRGGKR